MPNMSSLFQKLKDLEVLIIIKFIVVGKKKTQVKKKECTNVISEGERETRDETALAIEGLERKNHFICTQNVNFKKNVWPLPRGQQNSVQCVSYFVL